jgi:hypothetical protein
MNTIQKIQELFSSDLKPSVKLLTFYFRGVKIQRKGYAIETNTVRGLGRLEALTIEPIQSGDYKWFVYGGF